MHSIYIFIYRIKLWFHKIRRVSSVYSKKWRHQPVKTIVVYKISVSSDPGKSFGLKFIPINSEICMWTYCGEAVTCFSFCHIKYLKFYFWLVGVMTFTLLYIFSQHRYFSLHLSELNTLLSSMLQILVHSAKLFHRDFVYWVSCIVDEYEIATVRLQKLRTAVYAYTTDSKTDPKEKAKRIAEKIERKSLREMYDLSDLSISVCIQWRWWSREPGMFDSDSILEKNRLFWFENPGFFNRFVANRFCFAKNRIKYFLKYITKIIKIFEN